MVRKSNIPEFDGGPETLKFEAPCFHFRRQGQDLKDPRRCSERLLKRIVDAAHTANAVVELHQSQNVPDQQTEFHLALAGVNDKTGNDEDSQRLHKR